nr:MAG TPA: hypothetical protein [Caudoviricetes sp.]
MCSPFLPHSLSLFSIYIILYKKENINFPLVNNTTHHKLLYNCTVVFY